MSQTRFVRNGTDYYLLNGKPDPGYAFLPCTVEGSYGCMTVRIQPIGVERIAWAHHDNAQMRAAFLVDALSAQLKSAADHGYTPGWDDEQG